MALGDRLATGRAAFARGAFFEAHELWEEVWRGLDGEERTAVQGLIQLAAGLHHLGRGRPRPADRLLTRGLEKLSRCAPALRADLGIDALLRGYGGDALLAASPVDAVALLRAVRAAAPRQAP
jgi:predicted metal-dependent hydrolase